MERHPGRNFALYLDDSIEFLAALLGAWQAGKTIWLAADTLKSSCASLLASVDAFLGEFPAEYSPLLPTAGDCTNCGTASTLQSNFLALVVHTSGSTGAPQSIPKRLFQLGSEMASLETLFGTQIGDSAIVATVSHHHIYGLLFKVLWPFAAGRAVYTHSLSFPEELTEALGMRQCVLVTSPAHLKRLPSQLFLTGAPPYLRTVFSSGGPLARAVVQSAEKVLGQVPVEIYGSSETGGIAWRQQCFENDESWQPFPNVTLRLTEQDNLLEVRSPYLADKSWLRLADHAEPSGTGRFLMLGRSDRIVKIEEKRVSLAAIEALLVASVFVDDAHVLLCETAPTERQKLAAFIVVSSAGRAILDDGGTLVLSRLLAAALVGAIDPIALPRRWRYLNEMPVNAQGKTTHAQLLSLLDNKSAPKPHMPDFYQLEREEHRVVLQSTIPSNLFYFGGHFPGAPILAGVVQIDWAIAYGHRYFALPPLFRGMQALKFLKVIRAEIPIRLELTHDFEKQSLNFRYFSDIGQHASGRILFSGNATIDQPTKNAC
ncbi:MAG: AMP-binding protein [Nitrosospira sp.]